MLCVGLDRGEGPSETPPSSLTLNLASRTETAAASCLWTKAGRLAQGRVEQRNPSALPGRGASARSTQPEVRLPPAGFSAQATAGELGPRG